MDVISSWGGLVSERRTQGRSPGRKDSAKNMPVFSQFSAKLQNTTQDMKFYDIVRRNFALFQQSK
jgi:hypothetical protein